MIILNFLATFALIVAAFLPAPWWLITVNMVLTLLNGTLCAIWLFRKATR